MCYSNTSQKPNQGYQNYPLAGCFIGWPFLPWGDLVKVFWSQFTPIFIKLDHFINKQFYCIAIKWSSLQKRVCQKSFMRSTYVSGVCKLFHFVNLGNSELWNYIEKRVGNIAPFYGINYSLDKALKNLLGSVLKIGSKSF